MLMKQRTQYVDIAKGFSIIAVVLWHINFTIGNFSLFPIKTIVAGGGWHVPCFFLISGFFLKEEKLLTPLSFIRSKLSTLYLKILYFYIPATLLHNAFIHWGFYSIQETYGGKQMFFYTKIDFLKKLLAAILFAGREPIVGPLWFAYVLCLALIGYSIISFICQKIWKKNYTKARAILLIFLACISAIASNKLNLTLNRFSNTLVVMGLLAIGQHIFQFHREKFNSPILFICAILLFLQNAILNGDIALNNNNYNDLFHLFLGSLCMLHVICFISIKLEKTLVGKIVSTIGEKSFEVMALHIFIFHLISLIAFKFNLITNPASLNPSTNNFAIILCYCLIGTIVPVILALGWERLLSGIKKCASRK